MEIRLNAKCPRQWYRFVIELGHFGECANLLQYRENNEFRKNNPSLKKSPISQVCRRGGVNPRRMPRFTRKVAIATTSFVDLARFNEINHFVEIGISCRDRDLWKSNYMPNARDNGTDLFEN
jgi:hypothetical protein